MKTMAMLLAPLTLSFGVLLMLIGVYSLQINAKVEKGKNHRRAELAARIGGWLYIGGGIGIVVYAFTVSFLVF